MGTACTCSLVVLHSLSTAAKDGTCAVHQAGKMLLSSG